MSLGERLRTERQKKGWSQRELARRARVRHATIVEIETGARTETRTDIARRLAIALGVTVDYLVGMYETDEAQREATTAALVGA